MLILVMITSWWYDMMYGLDGRYIILEIMKAQLEMMIMIVKSQDNELLHN